MDKLELFGKEFIEQLRDVSIEEYLAIKNGEMKSEDAKQVFQSYSLMDKSSQVLADKIILNIIDRVLHNTLWMFERSNDFTICEKKFVDPENDVVEMSDGLAGELYSDEGWIEKFSSHPPSTGG